MSNNKEELILDVAKRIIEERGFFETTTDEIARRANVAKGTLYIYFKSKDELFLRLIEREYDRITSKLIEIADSDEDAVTKLDIVVEDYLNYMEKNRAFFLSLMYEAPSIKKKGIKEQMFKNARVVEDNLRKIVEQGVKGGVIREDVEVSVIISAIIGTLSRVIFHGIHFEKEKSLLSFKDGIMKIIFSGILKEKGGDLW